MQDKLSNLLTGFRKNHSTQHCLMCMLEIWKDMFDKRGYVCVLCLWIYQRPLTQYATI